MSVLGVLRCLCLVLLCAPHVTAEAPTTAPARSPVETIESLVEATNDPNPEVFRSLFHTEGDLEAQLLETMSRLIAASAKFRQSAVKAFGEADVEKFRLNVEKTMIPLDVLPKLGNLKVAIDGDIARVTDPATSAGVELRKIDGEWKIPMSDFVPAVKKKPDLIRQNMNALNGFASILSGMADGIDDGHFQTAEECAVIVRLRLTRFHEKSGAADAPKATP
jgi:hypothetical protein